MAHVNDLVTLAEAKSTLRVSVNDTASDSIIARVITSVSRRLDRCIGPSVVRAVTSEPHSGGRSRVELNYGPVQAFGAVIEYQTTSAVTLSQTVPGLEPTEGFYAERYAPEPSLYSGIIVRRIDAYERTFWSGSGNIVCSYTAGRSVSTGTVDAEIKEGALIMVRNWWRAYDQSAAGFGEFDVPTQNFPTYAVPNATKELLQNLWQSEIGFGAGIG